MFTTQAERDCWAVAEQITIYPLYPEDNEWDLDLD
jgi:hypothetical protein